MTASTFDALSGRVLDLIADGSSLRQIAAMEGMPATSTVMKWVRDNDAFSEQYTRACAMRIEGNIEAVLDLVDDPDIPADQKRVMLDARKWLACKLVPKKYGDRQTIEHDVSGNLADQLKAARERAANR